VSNDLTPMQTFEEKVKARLKETIADMLPDEALAALTQRAVDEQFFKTRRTGTGAYNDPYKDNPSWFVEEVGKLAEPIIRAHITEAFKERQSEINEAIKKFVADQNIALLMTTAITSNMSQMMFSTAAEIFERVKRGY
jgi:polyhydroxyalkanoate synthesis regulator protein